MPVKNNDLDFSAFDEFASSQEPEEKVYDFSVFDNNVKKKEPSKISSSTSQVGELESTTSIPPTEGEPKDLLSRLYKRKRLKDEAFAEGQMAVAGGTGGAGISVLPNVGKIQESNEEGSSILRDFNLKQNDLDNLDRELQDLPSEEERAQYKNPDGSQNLTFTNDALSRLREQDYNSYIKNLNTAKVYGSLYKTDKNLAKEYIKINNETGFVSDDVYENSRIRKDLKERQDELIAKSDKLTDEEKEKLIGYNNEIYSAIASKGIDNPVAAKDYLSKRLSSSSAELDVTPTASNLYENKKLYEGENIDDLPIESIQKFVDASNPADVRAFEVYKYTRAFDDAVKSSPNIEEAAINYMSTLDPVIDEQRMRLKEDGRDLPEIQKAEYVKAFLDDPRAQQLADVNPEFRNLYSQAKNSFNTKYKDYAVKRISEIISQEREDRGMNNPIINIPSESATDELVADLVKEGKLSEEDAIKYNKEIRPKVGVGQSLLRGTIGIPFGAFTGTSPIKTPGLAESALTGFQETTKSAARGVQDLPVVSSIAPSEAYRLESALASDFGTARVNYSKLHQLSEGTGHLMGFTVPMIFGGTALRGLGMTQKGAHIFNNFLLFEGGNRDEALKMFPNDPVKRSAFTILGTAGDMFLTELLPTKAARKGISKLLKKDIADVTEQLLNKQITPQIAEKTLVEKTLSYLPKAAVENAKTAGTLTLFNVYHNALGSLFGTNDLKAGDVAYQAVQDFKHNYLVTPFLTVLSMKGKSDNRKVDARILMQMGATPELFRKRIVDYAEKNNEPKDVTEEKLRNLDNASSILNDLSRTDLTQSQKEKFFIYALAEKAIKDQASKTTDSSLKKKYLEQAEGFNTVKEKILNGEDKATEFNKYEPDTREEQREINTESENAARRAMGEPEIKPEELKVEERVQEGVEPVRRGETEGEPAVLGVEEKEVVRQMKPITDEMVKVEREFGNNGFKIDTDYDNEIIVTDKNGEIVDPEELPDNLRKLAADYEAATSKLGEFSDTAREKALAESRKVTEVAAEEVKPGELPKAEEKTQEVIGVNQFAKNLNESVRELRTADGKKGSNYINKEGVEVTFTEDENGGDVNGNEVQADIMLDFIGNDTKRGEGLASKELDRIINEADKNNMSISLIIDSDTAVKGTESKKGLTNEELKKWYESKGFIFTNAEGSRYGYRPKLTEDPSRFEPTPEKQIIINGVDFDEVSNEFPRLSTIADSLIKTINNKQELIDEINKEYRSKSISKIERDEFLNELDKVKTLEVKALSEKQGELPEGEKPAVYTADNLDQVSTEGLDKTQAKVVGDVKNVVKAVSGIVKQGTGNELSVSVHTSPRSYERSVVEAGGSRQDATTKGFYLDKNGTIHLNMDKVTSETMLHEGFHPVLDFMEVNNPKVVETIYDQLNSFTEGQRFVESNKRRYTGEVTQKKEAITDFIANVADGSIVINPNNFAKIKKFIIDALNMLGFDLKSFKTAEVKDATELINLTKLISEKFKSGEEIKGEEVLSEITVDQKFQPVKNKGDVGDVSAAGTIDPAKIKDAKVMDINPLQLSREEFKEVELARLPVKSLEEALKPFNNKAIAINSDPTRVGKLKLISGEEIFMYGGLNYSSIKANVEGEIGFSSTALSKPKQVQSAISKLFPETNGEGLILVTSQSPESMKGNAYALEYVLDAIKQLPKSVLRTGDFKTEFFGKDIVAIKDAFGEQKYSEFVKKYGKADFTNDAVMKSMVSDLLDGVGSNFVARNSLVSNLLAGVALKSSRVATKGEPGYVSVTPNKYIAKQLFDRFGLNQEKLFYEIGEKGIVDVYMNTGEWGFITNGFTSDSKVDYMSIQDKGVVHPQFNAKFHGKDSFILDGGYQIDKLFLPEEIISQTGKPYTKKASLMVAGSMYPKGEVVPTARKTAERIPQFSREKSEKEDIITASVNVAPLYSTKVTSPEQAKLIHESDLYKNYKKKNEEIAKMFGLEVVSQEDGVGGYEFSNGEAVMEATTVINLKGKFSDIVNYAAMNGALTPEVQDATIAGMYVRKGSENHNADKVEVKIDNTDAAMKAAKDAGFDRAGFTLVDGEISFFNVFFHPKESVKFKEQEKDFRNKVITFVNKYKEYGGQIISKGTRAVRSEYIDNVRRREILGRIESAAVSRGQDWAGIRGELATAKERNTRYTTWKYLDKSETAKQYRSLRQKQFNLAAEGKSLSDAERSKMLELEKRISKLIATTFKTEAERSAYDQAKLEVDAIASDVANLIEGGYKSEFPTKRPNRAAIKTVRWYNSQPNLLGDGARTNVIVNTDADAAFLFNELTKRFPSATGRVESGTTELGYPKRLIEIRTSNGKLAEIQVMTPQGYLAKEGIKDFPKDAQGKAQKSLDETRERLGWDIPDGVGHYFYEINRDLNVPKKLREQAAEISRKYYDAFLNPASTLTDAEFRSDVRDFKYEVDKADKAKWDEGNDGKSPESLNKYLDGGEMQFSRAEEGEPEPKRVGLSKAEIAKQVEEFSMLSPARVEKISDADLDKMADDAIASGYDVGKLVDRLKADYGDWEYNPKTSSWEKKGGGVPRVPANDLEITILNKYAAALNAEQEARPSQETLKKYTEALQAARRVLSVTGATLRQARRSQAVVDNLSNFLVDKEVAQGAPLTENQIKVETEKYNELKKAKEELEVQLEIEKEKNAKLIAEMGYNKAKAAKAKAVRKSDAEYKAERKASLDAAKEALRKLRTGEGGVASAIVPGVRELMAIAPHVKDMVKSYAEQGLGKLEDVVNNIHADFKDLIEGLRKSDIIEIIAGKYDTPPTNTRNELAAKIRLFKREADLLLELADAKKGLEKAKKERNDKKEVSSNRRIKELEESLSETKKINKESLEMDEEVGEPDNQERIAKKQKQLLNRIEKLKDDIDNKRYLEEQQELPPLKMDKRTKAMIDRVSELQGKINEERLKDRLSKESSGMKVWRRVLQVLDLRRRMQTAFDISVSLRQGAPVLKPTTARIWWKSFMAQWSSLTSKADYSKIMYDIRHSEDYHEMIEDGIIFNDIETPNEDFSNTHFIMKVPVVGGALSVSQRAADGFLNTARYELYMKFKRNLEKQGITRQSDPKEYKHAAKLAMNMTGRGNLIKSFESSDAQTLLGNTFYGARLMASRFNMLNPYVYLKMSPEIRKRAILDMVEWTGTLIAVGASLSQIPGVSVSLNPDDSDFLQIRYKDKVYDLSGGFNVYVRTFLRITESGLAYLDEPEYVRKKKQDNAGKSFLNFFRNKLAPNFGSTLDLFFGTSSGKKSNPYDFSKMYPMYVDDFVDAWKKDGIVSFATVLAPNILGVGYGAYSRKGELETDVDKLIERNMNASYMDYSNIKNYKDNGRPITDDEFLKFAEVVDEKVAKKIRKIYDEGKWVVNDDGFPEEKKYSELTPDQVNRAISSIKQNIQKEVQEDMFGDEDIMEKIKEKQKKKGQKFIKKIEEIEDMQSED